MQNHFHFLNEGSEPQKWATEEPRSSRYYYYSGSRRKIQNPILGLLIPIPVLFQLHQRCFESGWRFPSEWVLPELTSIWQTPRHPLLRLSLDSSAPAVSYNAHTSGVSPCTLHLEQPALDWHWGSLLREIDCSALSSAPPFHPWPPSGQLDEQHPLLAICHLLSSSCKDISSWGTDSSVETALCFPMKNVL